MEIHLLPSFISLVSLPGIVLSPLFAKAIIGQGFEESLLKMCIITFVSNTLLLFLHFAIIFFNAHEGTDFCTVILFCGIPVFLLDRLILYRLCNSARAFSQVGWNFAWRLLSSLPLFSYLVVGSGARMLMGD